MARPMAGSAGRPAAKRGAKRGASLIARRAGSDGALRAPLTRDRVVRAAIELADREGIDALSMRKLAEELEVEAMSLYHHVANKEDLLGGMVDVVMGQIEMPAGKGRRKTGSKASDTAGAASWKADIRRGAISAREMLRRHPWARGVLTSPAGLRPVRIRFMDWLLGRLRRGGFSAELTYHAYHALDSHIIGSAAWAAGYLAFANDRRAEDIAKAAMRELPMDQLPYVAEHMQQHMTGFGKGTSQFEFGLDILLDGLDRMRDAPPPPRPPTRRPRPTPA